MFLVLMTICTAWVVIKPVVNVSVALAVNAFDLQLNVVVLVVEEATDRDFKCWKHSPRRKNLTFILTVCPSASLMLSACLTAI